MRLTRISEHEAVTIPNRPAIWLAVLLGWSLAPGSAVSAQSTVQFANPSYRVNEAAGTVTLAVQRTGEVNAETTVDYATVDGSATNGLKYVAISGTLAFAAGETNRTLVVPILNDGLADGTKSFQVILSNPTNAVLGTTSNATVSIEDNDTGIQFRFASYPPSPLPANCPLVTEDLGAVRIGVVRGDDGELPVTVDYATSDLTATSGADYTGVTNTLAFAPGELLKFFTVPILNDSLKEGNKTFRLTLSHPTGTTLGPTRTATVTITDNDAGFEFESASYSVGEDAGAVRIRVLRGSDDATSPVTVDYAVADVSASSGVDYAATTGTLSFSPGEKYKEISVPILNDGSKESSESFRVTLGNPTAGAVLGTRTTATVSIQDNDPGLGFELASYAEWERAGSVTLTVVRGNDTNLGPVTVDFTTSDGTARAGEDYQAVSGTLEFQQNETVKTFAIPVLPDGVGENTETFRVTLSNTTGDVVLGTSTTTVAIADNYCPLAPPCDARLSIRREGDGNRLTWTGQGQLLRADRVEGPWETLTAAKGPCTVQSPLPAAFYRIKYPRPVTLYVPSGYDGQTPMPLVILLHGAGSSGQSVEDWMRFRPLADARGFLCCYPDAAVDPWGRRHWSEPNLEWDPSSDLGLPVVDDPAFLSDIIEETARRFALDRKRVYLIGHSSGGIMCYRMACERADLIAGIASLCGSQAVDPGVCRPSAPVHILEIRGTADDAARYWGFAVTIAAGYYVNTAPAPGAVRLIQIWAGYNGASDPVTEVAPTMDLVLDVVGLDTVVTRYQSHPPGGAVELWTIHGGAHRPTLSSEFAPNVVDWLLAHPKP